MLYEIGEGEVACCSKHGLAAEGGGGGGEGRGRGRGGEMGEIKSLSTFTLLDYFSRNLRALLSTLCDFVSQRERWVNNDRPT